MHGLIWHHDLNMTVRPLNSIYVQPQVLTRTGMPDQASSERGLAPMYVECMRLFESQFSIPLRTVILVLKGLSHQFESGYNWYGWKEEK
jgi:hypothetical protein